MGEPLETAMECWKSCRPGKVAWKLVDVQGLACTIRSGLPLSVAQVIESAAWKGGPLIQLTDTITRPQADDLVLNHCWIKPFVQKFREKVPSGFFVVDTFLYLDKLYNGKLLQPLNAGDSKHSLASEEAKKVKLLIGTLRALWRSSKAGSHPRISELKALLLPSPTRSKAKASDPPPAHDSEDDDGGEEEVGDQEMVGPEENSSPGEGSGDEGDSQETMFLDGGIPKPLALRSRGDEGGDSESDSDDEGPPPLESPSGENDLVATTSPDDDSPPPAALCDGAASDQGGTDQGDSSSTSSSADEESLHTPDKRPWNEELFTSPMCGNSGPPRSHIVEMCISLMQFFGSNHPEIMKNYHLVNYMDHCEWAFARFGLRASSWLATPDYFDSWLNRFKELGNKVLSPQESAKLSRSCPEAVAAEAEFRKTTQKVDSGSAMGKLLRQNALDSGERKGYSGGRDGKTPSLQTPPPSMGALERALESNLTPPPIGMQTAT
ncbi:30S ribosomal protein S6, partial [Durusdinium trenchii]